MSAPPSEILGAAWEGCLAAWDDQKRHDALLQLVAANGTYAWAAGRYRSVTAERPDDAVAKRQLERLSRAAMATMFASATARRDNEPKPYRATMAILVMMIVAIVAGLLYATVSSNSTPSPHLDQPQSTPATPQR